MEEDKLIKENEIVSENEPIQEGESEHDVSEKEDEEEEVEAPPKEKAHRITLSMKKLLPFLHKFSYRILVFYTVVDEETGEDNARFIEIKTPRYEKIFMLSIPLRYRLVIDDTHKKIPLTLLKEPSKRHLEYLMETKGTLLDSDVVSISSTFICSYRHNAGYEGTECFYIGDDAFQEVNADDVEDEIENVEKLEAEVQKIASDIDPSKSEEPIKDKETKLLEPKEEDGVALIFEDDEGNPIDDVKQIISNKHTENEEEEEDEEIDFGDDEDEGEEVDFRDEEIELGLVYIMVELNVFFKKIGENFENEIVKLYDTLDEAENERRSTQVTKIQDLLQQVSVNLNTKLEELKAKEDELRESFMRLTSLVTDTNHLLVKTGADAKLKKNHEETERLSKQIQSAIHDINVEKIKLKDKITNLLSTHILVLSDLLESEE
jgi:hypothetical protein